MYESGLFLRCAQDSLSNHRGFLKQFAVKNHGVSASLVETAFAAGKNFFDLPIDEKLKVTV